MSRAITFIGNVLAKHGKKPVLSHVAHLATVEHRIRELQPWQRDHVVHAVRVFLVGMYLNEHLLGRAVDPLQWKIAGLTHAVGYPLEISAKVGSEFGIEMNAIAAQIGSSIPPLHYQAPRIEGLDQLTRGQNAGPMIQARLREWGIDIDVATAYQQRTQEGTVCHGIISAFAVLRVLDMLYEKSNPRREYINMEIGGVDWNQRWFDTDNVSACAAIFLHNLDLPWFHKTRVQADKAPVAFLLRLADTLQEWERPSGKDPNGFSPDLFELEIAGRRMHYRARIDDGRKRGITNVLDGTLENNPVVVE